MLDYGGEESKYLSAIPLSRPHKHLSVFIFVITLVPLIKGHLQKCPHNGDLCPFIRGTFHAIFIIIAFHLWK